MKITYVQQAYTSNNLNLALKENTIITLNSKEYTGLSLFAVF